MHDFNKIKEDIKSKYKKKDFNFLGLLLAAVCVFLAIIIPITITNNEVKAAKEAAAEAARIAFEEARQAAIEAEKKAEEERLANLSAALSQEQAQLEAERAAKEAEEKAAREREELATMIQEKINESVVSSVGQMIDDQTSEDFNTQYTIQDKLIETQKSSVSGYETYVAQLLDLYDQKYELDKKESERINSEHFKETQTVVESVNENLNEFSAKYESDREEDKNNAILEAEKAEKEKHDSHYNTSNRIDITATSESLAIQYLKKTPVVSYGLKTGFLLDEDKDLLVMGTVDFTLIDEYEYNFGLEAGTGIVYRFTNKKFMPAFHANAVCRFTVKDGFEFQFRPGVLVETDFSKSVDIKMTPLTFGISFAF